MDNFSSCVDTFFWDDIRKENTIFNFLILTHLCEAKKVDLRNGYLLNKPILIILVGIIECILYDLIKRISAYEYKNDPIPGIDFMLIVDHNDIKKAQEVPDKFKQVILYFEQSPKLLEMSKEFYKKLHDLRQLRNRIHIQVYDKKNKNENNIWTAERIQLAGKILVRLCITLGSKFSRSNKEIILTSLKFLKLWQD